MGWVKPESPSTPWTSTVAPKTEYKPLPSPPTVWSTGLGGIDNWEVRRLPLVNIQGKTGYVAEVTPEGKVLVEQATILVQGSDGVKEVPVKVDAEGRLVLASGVTVNAEGLVVDLGQIKQGPPGTEPWPVELSSAGTPVPVELTGNVVEPLPTAFKIRSTGHKQNVAVAAGATGVILSDWLVDCGTKIAVGVQHKDGAHNYYVYMDEYGTGAIYQFSTPILGSSSAPTNPGTRVLSTPKDLRSLRVTVAIRNQDTVDHVYDNLEAFIW